jgi:type I restriction enzyme R subunit
VVESFQQFFAAHKDAIVALQILYSRPYGQQRLSFAQVRELAARLEQPPLSLTTEALWRAYVQLEQDRVRGVGGQRVLADLVALVRHAVEPGGELAPYPEHVRARYEQWLERQQANGRVFTPEQRWWLDRIAEQIGVNLSVAPEDFDYGEFFKRGGRLGALRALGTDWTKLLDELNSELTA